MPARARVLSRVAAQDLEDGELEGVKQVFLTSSVRGARPVIRSDPRAPAAPGPVCRRAQRPLADAGLVVGAASAGAT